MGMKKGRLLKEFNFATTFQHPLAQRGIVEMLPTKWVQALANKKAGRLTNIDPDSTDLLDLDRLWEDMCEQGMHDPFVLSAGRYTRECRLEAGNHRIQLFSSKGVPYVPAVTLVADGCIISPLNGDHRYKRALLIEKQHHTNKYLEERVYAAPSDIFAEIRVLKQNGRLPCYEC